MATNIYELIPNFQQHLMTLGEFAQWFPKMEYHNYDNSMMTAARAYLAANECQLPENDQRNLTLAALYADTKYVGYFDDEKNVENSIAFWNDSFKKVRKYSEEDYCQPQLVENLIRSTRQGYRPDPREANWLLKALLHDCIVLQALSPEWRSYLEKEIYDSVTLDEVYNSLITDWAKDYYNAHVDELNSNNYEDNTMDNNKNEVDKESDHEDDTYYSDVDLINTEDNEKLDHSEDDTQEVPLSLPNINK